MTSFFLRCLILLQIINKCFADPLFDFPLDKIFVDKKLPHSLELFLRQCQKNETYISNLQSNDFTPCKKTRYISELLIIQKKIWTQAIKSKVQQEETSSFITRKFNSDFSFGDFFEFFELKRKPVLITGVKGVLSKSNATNDLFLCVANNPIPDFDDITQKKMHNADGNNQRQQSISFLQFSSCPDFSLQRNFNFPKYIVNDYFRRLNMTTLSLLTHDLLSKSLQIAHFAPNDQMSPSEASCPSSLHGLYVVIRNGSNINRDRISERVVANDSPTLKAKMLNPDGITDLEPFLVVNDNPVPHYKIDYGKNPWDLDDPIISKRHLNIAMNQNDAIFVPTGFAISFRNVNNMAAKNNSSVILLRSCFVDASNFNIVKSYLQLDQDVNNKSKLLLSKLSDPEFNIGMQRDPDLADEYEKLSSSFKRNEQPLCYHNEHKNCQERKPHRVQKKRQSSFNNWQIDKEWHHRITGLTLPTLDPPKVFDIGRNTLTISWICPFQKKKGDSTRIQYIVVFKEYPSGKVLDVTYDEDSLEIEFIASFTYSIQKNYNMYMTDSKTGARKFMAKIHDLKASSQYEFKVAIKYGEYDKEYTSLLSRPSNLITTSSARKPRPLSTPPQVLGPNLWNEVLNNPNINTSGKQSQFQSSYRTEVTTIMLHMRAPYDDGGLEIIAFDVMAIEFDSTSHAYINDWVLFTQDIEEIKYEKKPGGHILLGIHNLIPCRLYEFKVATRNVMGRSAWSYTSGKASTYFPLNNACHESHRRFKAHKIESTHGFVPPNGYQVHGIGTHVMSSTKGYLSDEHKKPVLKINGIDQVLTIVGMIDNIEVWLSFWSPKDLIVVAELCFVFFDGETGKIKNSNDIKSRITVFNRNDNMLSISRQASQAQQLGSLAVIILDASERCIEFDQYCMFGSSKKNGDYWGELDSSSIWESIRIPVILARRTSEVKDVINSIL